MNSPAPTPSGSKRYLDPTGSTNRGFKGLFETFIRRFKQVSHAATMLPFYALASMCMGLAATPGLILATRTWHTTADMPEFAHFSLTAMAIAAGYFLYGFSMILVVPTLNFVLGGRLKPWRGTYFSAGTLRWYLHNALTYVVRYTFLEFVTPTPFNILFYRLMGMHIGRGTQINTSHISDPSLIELGENVTVGGSAVLIAHYGMGGLLIIARVKIGSRAVIGLRAIIMGDVEIGEDAKVLPNSVVLPKTRIPAGETWGGVPAQKIERKSESSQSSTQAA